MIKLSTMFYGLERALRAAPRTRRQENQEMARGARATTPAADMPDEVKTLCPTRALCAESPLWDPRRASFCWTDIDGRRLYRVDEHRDSPFSRAMPGRVGCIAMYGPDGYIAAMEDSVVILDADFAICRTICTTGFAPLIERFNDGKLDRSGAFFFVGSIYLPRDRKAAGIWRLSHDGTLTKVVVGLTTANGIAWSPDGSTMYFRRIPGTERFGPQITMGRVERFRGNERSFGWRPVRGVRTARRWIATGSTGVQPSAHHGCCGSLRMDGSTAHS